MSWCRTSSGFELLSNRDELRRRPRAEAPRICERQGVRWIAPRDPEGGGTWLVVNDHGVAMSLLNGDQDGDLPEVPPSRGQIVEALAISRDLGDVESWFEARDLSSWRAFRLIALDAFGGVASWTWEAGTLEVSCAPRPPFASSSFRPPEVRSARQRLWEQTVEQSADVDGLLAFHRSHEPSRGPHSVCMHREDAATVSSTWISVGNGRVVLRYADGPPCRVAWADVTSLPLRTAV